MFATGHELQGDGSLLCLGKAARLGCCYHGKALISKKCTSHRWLCPTPRIQHEPDPFVWEHFLPKPGAFLVLQAHLSLFICFFAEPGKGYTRDPSQKHPRGLTTSKEKDTTPRRCPTQTYSVSQLRKLKPTGHSLFSFFFLSERDSSAFRTQRLSGLLEPRLQKATANTKKKKKEKQTHKNPPSLPPKLSGERGAERERGMRHTGKAAGCSPFLPPFYSC